ncbi:MAG: hypothetical protein ACI4JC_10870 [Faecalibacterium sp.]
MRKLWSCIFYSLCLFTIVFSLTWMAQPKLSVPDPPLPQEQSAASVPSVAAQAQTDSALVQYYLCDEGGRLAVYRCGPDGTPTVREQLTGIYVNLLPEGDALRIKHGLTVQGRQALDSLLEDLGN